MSPNVDGGRRHPDNNADLGQPTSASAKGRPSVIRLAFVFAVAGFASMAGSTTAVAQDMSRAAAQIAPRLTESGKTSVAVVDFTDLQMNVTELGRFLAEELQGAIVAVAKGFKVVDRTH